MERNISINHILETMDRSIVKKYLQLPFRSYLLVILGVFILYFSYRQGRAHKELYESVEIIAGIALILWGFLVGVDEKYYFKHVRSKTKICFHEVFFERKDFQKLTSILESGNFDKLNSLQRTSSYHVKLRIAYSEDKSFCMVQGIRYIPFEYAELTKAKHLDEFQTEKLFESIEFSGINSKYRKPYLI